MPKTLPSRFFPGASHGEEGLFLAGGGSAHGFALEDGAGVVGIGVAVGGIGEAPRLGGDGVGLHAAILAVIEVARRGLAAVHAQAVGNAALDELLTQPRLEPAVE